MYLTRNQAMSQGIRGFESHPLRQRMSNLPPVNPLDASLVLTLSRPLVALERMMRHGVSAKVWLAAERDHRVANADSCGRLGKSDCRSVCD